MFRTVARLGILVLLIHLMHPQAIAEDPENRRISIQQSTLYFGYSPFTIRALGAPSLFSPGATHEQTTKGFIRLSDAGASSLWFDLSGLDPTGAAIDPEHLTVLREVKAACIYRIILPICRVFPDDAPDDPAYRMAAVRTVAKTFQGDTALLYWIDGPRSEQLAAEFKKHAPHLIVLSPQGGDIDLIQRPGQAKEGKPALLMGRLPEPFRSPAHCMLPGADEDYAAMEKAAADPIENAPWTPTTHGLSRKEIAEGFVSLFDGKSFDGWTFTGRNKKGFIIKNSAIHWAERGGGVLRTRDRYTDFILRLDWKIHKKGGNSGIFLRAPRANRMSKMGFEFQIMGDQGKPPGIHSTGAIYDVLAPQTNASKRVGKWNSLEIRMQGQHFTAILNGTIVQDRNLNDHPETRYRKQQGFIGLQDHSSPVSFRNIRIKTL